MRCRDAPGEEVAQVVELAMRVVLDVNHAPAVLAATDRPAVNDHVALRADDCEGDDALRSVSVWRHLDVSLTTHSDGLVRLHILVVLVLVIKRIGTDVVVRELGADL